MPFDFSNFTITAEHPIRDAIACIDHNSKGIVLVVDSAQKLIGTITDGDIRRAMLAGQNLDLPVSALLAQKTSSLYPKPITAPKGTESAGLLQMMKEHSVHQIPLLDLEGRVAGLVTMDDLLPDQLLPLQAVVMAGGFGHRLRPLTEDLPKPMLPLGDRPLLRRVIEQLRDVGIRRVNLTTHYKREMIEDHFGDGKDFGVDIRYVNEDQPMGTAGVLGLLERSEEPLLVINGDILTDVDFGAMLRFHKEHESQMTVAVRSYDFHIPYGVVDVDDVHITGVSEKPKQRYFINAGIYLINPDVCAEIPKGQHCDMPDLINRLVKARRRVISFPIREYWLDIGKIEDYRKALEDVEKGKI